MSAGNKGSHMSTDRDTFPYITDRHVIEAFLHRRRAGGITTCILSTDGSTLKIGLRGAEHTVAWYDSSGAIAAKLLNGFLLHYSSKVVEYINRTLGAKEFLLQRESEAIPADMAGDHGLVNKHSYFVHGNRISPEEPFLLAGPLSIAAWRESERRSERE